MYYLYSKNKEISSYIVSALESYELSVIKDATLAFDIDSSTSLLIFHLESFDGDRVEFLTQLLDSLKDLKILILSNTTNFSDGTKLLQAGVKGYGNTYMHSVLLKQAIDVIKSENIWIYPELTQHLIKNLTKAKELDEDKLKDLTPQEKECTKLVSEGSSNKEIASILELQEITIKKHLSSVYKKLSVKNRIELALYYNSL